MTMRLACIYMSYLYHVYDIYSVRLPPWWENPVWMRFWATTRTETPTPILTTARTYPVAASSSSSRTSHRMVCFLSANYKPVDTWRYQQQHQLPLKALGAEVAESNGVGSKREDYFHGIPPPLRPGSCGQVVRGNILARCDHAGCPMGKNCPAFEH